MRHPFSFEELIGYVLGILSILIPFMVVVSSNFPYTGLSVSFLSLSILVYIINKQKTACTATLLASACASSLFLFIRANEFLALLNILTIIYTNSISLLISRKQPLSVVTVITAPITLIFSSLTIQTPVFPFKVSSLSSAPQRIQNPHRVLLSTVITAGLLLLIIPLLSSANPLFNDLVINVISSLHLDRLNDWIGSMFDTINIVRYIIAAVLFILLPRIATHAVKEYAPGLWQMIQKPFTLENPPLLFPKIAVSIVLFIFFITQMQLYFSSAETLLAMGYTQSQYAREVFAQLSIVALIIFGLIYNDRQQTGIHRTMTLILIIEALFLTGMAYKSDYDYSSLWGFTHKRLYGFAVATWIGGVLAIFTYHYLNRTQTSFLKHSIIYTSIILFSINIANFDRLIYAYARPSTHTDTIDYEYLTFLSSDAQAYHTLLPQLRQQVKTDPYSIDTMAYALEVMKRNIQGLHIKYDNPDVRIFNLSEYHQYLLVKDIDTTELQHFIDTYRPYSYPTPIPSTTYQ